MKKLSLLIPIILLLSLGGIHAQQNYMKFSHGVAKNVPMEVLAAIDAGYPGLKIQQQLLAPAQGPSQTYYVHHKGKNYLKRGKYNKEGKLLYSKEKIHNVALPVLVYKYIGREYNGWAIKKTMVVKTIETSPSTPRHSTYFKVLLQNGKKKQRVLLDEHGKLYSRK